MATLLFKTETLFHTTYVYSCGEVVLSNGSSRKFKIKIELSKMKDKFSRASIFREEEMRWICLVEDNYVIPKKSVLQQSKGDEMEIENIVETKNNEKITFYFDCLQKILF